LALMATISLSAWAGPNWEIIHQERRDEASAFRAIDAAPIDHGPRPLATQWLDQKLEKQRLAARHEKSKSMLSAGKAASTHS
ncbi:MAG TPA: hypothetical protein PLK99_09475, partial [Burkholderiales bacterium]|nr:hypothetical protein [Burkholderiales bacterium]